MQGIFCTVQNKEQSLGFSNKMYRRLESKSWDFQYNVLLTSQQAGDFPIQCNVEQRASRALPNTVQCTVPYYRVEKNI